MSSYAGWGAIADPGPDTLRSLGLLGRPVEAPEWALAYHAFGNNGAGVAL